MQFGQKEQIYCLKRNILAAAYMCVPSGLVIIKKLSQSFTLGLTLCWWQRSVASWRACFFLFLPLTRQECVSSRLCMTTKTLNCSRCSLQKDHQTRSCAFQTGEHRTSHQKGKHLIQRCWWPFSVPCKKNKASGYPAMHCSIVDLFRQHWQANRVGVWTQGFTSAAIFELRGGSLLRTFSNGKTAIPFFHIMPIKIPKS